MAASTSKLGDLHELVATALAEQIKGYEEEYTDKEGEVQTRFVRPSPAVMAAAIAFLKNNNITADPEGNAALRTLNEQLKARREKRIPQSALDDAASAFAASVGAGNFMQ